VNVPFEKVQQLQLIETTELSPGHRNEYKLQYIQIMAQASQKASQSSHNQHEKLLPMDFCSVASKLFFHFFQTNFEPIELNHPFQDAAYVALHFPIAE
jgi:hypothetical protein